MVYFSNSQETSDLFGGHIEQVQQALAAHHVHFGAPRDFPAFAETLETDSRLRNDLAVLARSFMAGDESVSLRTVLSILSIASGGPDLAASDDDMSQPVSVLVDFLISVSRPASAENPDSPTHPIDAASHQDEHHKEETYQPFLPPPPSLNRQTPERHEEETYETFLPPPPSLNRHTPEHYEEETYQPFLPPPPSLDRQTPGHETLSHQTPLAQIRPDPDPDPDPVNDTADLSPLETSHTLPNLDRDTPRHEMLSHPTPPAQIAPSPLPNPVPEPVPEPVNDTADLSPLETAPTLPNLDPSPHSGAGNSLVESLTRLELNSLQVKHYLDSIDQRISRIEPRLDNLPTHVLPAAPPHLGHAAEARYSSVLTSEPLPDLPPDEPPLPEPPQTQTTKPPEIVSQPESPRRPVPLQAPARNKVAIPVTTAVAAALLVSLLYWGFGRNKSSITIQSVPAPTAENRTSTLPNPAPAAGVNTSNSPAATAPTTQSPVATAPTLSPRIDTRAPSHSTQIHRSLSSSPSSAGATTPSTPPAGTRVELPKPSAASLAGPEESTYSSTLTPEPVNVRSGIMAANVLSAPQPSYPKLASLTRMQGAVVMQAIISREGTIEHVHVIKGHRLLRGAATSAVRNWRYRPYLVNGHPVEVATIVSVDFKLPQ